MDEPCVDHIQAKQLHFLMSAEPGVKSKAKTLSSQRKDFSIVLCSSFHARTPSSPDKTAVTAASTLITSAAAGLDVTSSSSFLSSCGF